MGIRPFFGLVGLLSAIGCALLLNALFAHARTSDALQSTHTLLFRHDPEIVRRLRQAGAQFGDPQFSLMWHNRNDLDLHVVEPGGTKIWYRNKLSPSGGMLDVDANADPLRLTSRPVENIFWAPGSAPQGDYQVYVSHYARHGDPDPTPYTLRIVMNGHVREFTGSLRHREQSETIRVNPAAVADWTPLGGRSLWWLALLVMGGWGAGVGLVLALLLRLPQRLFGVPRAELTPLKILGGMVGGGVLGLAAGVGGQAVYALLVPLSETIARLAGLALLGGLLGYGLAHFVPNLPVNPARWAGVVGGILASFAFAWALNYATDATGRWLVSGAIGLAIGLMIHIARVLDRIAVVRAGGTLKAPQRIMARRVEV